ncbi:MAG: carbamoyltransferase HypF, partial [Euryarchaeota archaeon]|nr:carbamoyltransferase HypF [Euryarchaeota archaeon]
PVRMIAGMLYDVYEEARLQATLVSLGLSELESSILIQQIERKINVPLTSSTGRVLDAVAAALDVCQKRTYDGEPAMRLEGVAHYGYPSVALPVEITSYAGRPVLDTRLILDAVLVAKQRGERTKDIAASAQNTIAEGIAMIAAQAAEAMGVNVVGLSGGVAYNKAIVKKIKSVCALSDLELFSNTAVPRGDGGISFGQAVLTAMIKSGQYELAIRP